MFKQDLIDFSFEELQNFCSDNNLPKFRASQLWKWVYCFGLNAFDERRHNVVDKLNSIEGISCILPEGAFYAYPNVSGLIGKRTKNGKILNNDAEIVEWLLESAEVAAVPGVAFGLEPYFRVSYATSLDVLKEAMNRIEKAVLTLS